MTDIHMDMRRLHLDPDVHAYPQRQRGDSITSATSSTESYRNSYTEDADHRVRRMAARSSVSGLRHSATTRWLRKEQILTGNQPMPGWTNLSIQFRLTSTKEYEITLKDGSQERARLSMEEIQDAITEDGQALELVGILFNPEKLATFLKNKFAAPLKREISLRSGSRS
eukprot:m.164314 g.164314  ORF g.164314 m.164314 type:complete len:169 (-) comp12404_c0_seq1:245-751(-)